MIKIQIKEDEHQDFTWFGLRDEATRNLL